MKAYIKAISYYLPKSVYTNQDLVREFPEWTVEKVMTKVGISQRHIAAEHETASDLAVEAAEKLFTENNIDRSSIDFVLFCTQSPDYFLPASACLIQQRLHLPNSIGALDFNQGCSGFIYGLSLAKGLIMGKIAKNVLLLTGETYQKYIHPSDKGNKSIFGDGGTATLVSVDGFAEIGDFSLGTDGSGAKNLILETGGARNKEKLGLKSEDVNGASHYSDYLYMNGSEIFNFSLDKVPALVDSLLDIHNVKKEDIDLFIFHQANKFMLDTLRKICRIPKDHFYVNIENTGNTVSCTLPIAIKQALDQDLIKNGTKIMITGFGVGYSWGGTILNFN